MISTPIRVVPMLSVTDAMLVDCNVPEDDHPVWSAGAYVAGDRRIFAHRIYECTAALTSSVDPSLDAAHWLNVSATNRWKMFDQVNGSQTKKAGSLVFSITPGKVCTAFALLNVVGNEVRVEIEDPVDGVFFDQTYSLVAPISSPSWFAYFFEEQRAKRQVVITGLPTYLNAKFTITVDAGAGEAAVGVVCMGKSRDIGSGMRYGASLGIQDYSRKDRNAWGEATLEQREYADRNSLTTYINNEQLDWTRELLTGLRATPCLWIGSPLWESTVIYGFYNTFEISIPYRNDSLVSITLEGLI